MVMVARKGMPNGVYWTQVRNLFFQHSIVELSIPEITFGPEVWTFSFPDAGLLKIEKDPIFFFKIFFFQFLLLENIIVQIQSDPAGPGKFGCLVPSSQETQMTSPVEPYMDCESS